jgi:antitoxin MazE
MKARMVKIGNSRGIRIPKPLIEQTGITNEVEIKVSGNTLVISPSSPPRTGWSDAFRLMSESGDDTFLDPGSTQASDWDREEWEW